MVEYAQSSDGASVVRAATDRIIALEARVAELEKEGDRPSRALADRDEGYR